ncbi:MAG: sulfatase-like hydrolase/transferase [Bacteroidales bacterium]|nr:sulfatase-like hydrolase/transferase [Bacteroidales bacterium]
MQVYEKWMILLLVSALFSIVLHNTLLKKKTFERLFPGWIFYTLVIIAVTIFIQSIVFRNSITTLFNQFGSTSLIIVCSTALCFPFVLSRIANRVIPWHDGPLFKEMFLFSIAVNAFLVSTLLIFSPYEIFLNNAYSFAFSFLQFWWILALSGVLIILIVSSFYAFLPERLYKITITLEFGIALCFYIQSLFLNYDLLMKAGIARLWSTRTEIINLCIWIIIIAAPFLLKVGSILWKNVLKNVSIALIAIQLIGTISLLINPDIYSDIESSDVQGGYISTKGMFDLSKERNVVVFIVDYFDGRVMNTILNEDQTFLQPLKGFTYFPNATSIHSRTYPSLTYLLTGEMCLYNLPPRKYINDAFEKSSFFTELQKNNTNIGYFSDKFYLGKSAKEQISNFEPSKIDLSYKETIRNFLEAALFKNSPYLFKLKFRFDAAEINNSVLIEEKPQNDSTSPYYTERAKFMDDIWFRDQLDDKGVTANNLTNAFRFYHLQSFHKGFNVENAKNALLIIYEYLDQMQQIGVYENSTIIIIADHGYHHGEDESSYLPQNTAVPLIIVKPFGADATSDLKISLAPVSHTDFMSTVVEGFGLSHDQYGRTFFEIRENEDRDRYYYLTFLQSEERGEVELREFLVNADARYASSYKFTGNRWKILYSRYKIFQ